MRVSVVSPFLMFFSVPNFSAPFQQNWAVLTVGCARGGTLMPEVITMPKRIPPSHQIKSTRSGKAKAGELTSFVENGANRQRPVFTPLSAGLTNKKRSVTFDIGEQQSAMFCCLVRKNTSGIRLATTERWRTSGKGKRATRSWRRKWRVFPKSLSIRSLHHQIPPIAH
jgi:hypothetical protein